MANRENPDRPPRATPPRLGSLIKRVRDLMRTDPGINGDLDRLSQLSWMLFLKAFDDQEEARCLEDPDYRPLLRESYRWRNWAANEHLTGEPLIEFINGDLLPTLRALGTRHGGVDLAVKVGHVFEGVENRMRSSHRIRDVLNELNEVHFTFGDDAHVMAGLYESMLQEMRDAAGYAGEFYTPRPVVRFMVQQVDPKAGELVLDPAAGTGGFLVATLEHIDLRNADSVLRRQQLEDSVRGVEKKSLPYLLSMMNLMLSGVDVPAVQWGNSLSILSRSPVIEDQVDVVLTNPPFGGVEEAEIVKVFPEQYRTSETAWLFLTAVLDVLKPGGRCGIVLPNGVLFSGGVGARVKERLLKECNLHTVVRLPVGVFAPYTSIPSNVLFFEKRADGKAAPIITDGDWATEEVWFYEVPPPEGRRGYSKTVPMHFQDFEDCIAWWGGPGRVGRVATPSAWRAGSTEIRDAGFNLDIGNPREAKGFGRRASRDLLDELVRIQEEISTTLAGIQSQLRGEPSSVSYPERPVGDFLVLRRDIVAVRSEGEYHMAGIRSHGEGLIDRGVKRGAEISYRKLTRLSVGQVVLGRLNARDGALAVVPENFAGYFVSSEYPTFVIDDTVCDPDYVKTLLRWPGFWGRLTPRGALSGRMRVAEADFLTTAVPFPELAEQRRVFGMINLYDEQLERLVLRRDDVESSLRSALLDAAFDGEL